jgi:subtilisin family serine protease
MPDVSPSMKRVALGAGVALSLVALGGDRHAVAPVSVGARTEVVVELRAPALAYARHASRRIALEHSTFRSALRRSLPDARISWSYRLVENGFAVSAPRADIPRLSRLPGVRGVIPSVTYSAAAEDTPGDIGAPAIWGSNLETAGQGVKIGIIDSGVDQRHAFFDPAGYSMPKGFPKGQRQFTTAKVIVARSFPPPGAPASDRLAFARGDASHGTHVAGIAAGDASTPASAGRVLSGVAPKAYLGNYKVFVPTIGGPNAGAAEIVAAIEAAVADGMNVINFSGGEAEVEPSRDLVARALDAAAAKGVIPVVSAGNSGEDQGAGSVSSPASAASAIAAAAVEFARATPVHADFSSIGPTPISLRLKPDVAAPGVGVVSSIPRDAWGALSGTSMAAPHVAGAAALLRERHPSWSVDQIKAALVETGSAVRLETGSAVSATPAYVGGGLVSLPQADQPLVFASPSSLSFGLLPRGTSVTHSLSLTDAGGGAGTWQVGIDDWSELPGASVVVPPTVDVPGRLDVQLVLAADGQEGDATGYVTLRRGTDVRHVPFWGRVESPRLERHEPKPLATPGLHRGSTAGQPAFVSRYRYPDDPRSMGVHAQLGGPELVYRVRIPRRVANFGVVITREAMGAAVEPRIVQGLDENRLTGLAALPVVINPWLPQNGARVRVSASLVPRPGDYAVVFDSPRVTDAGRFTFRFWVDDVTPPTVKLVTRVARRGPPLLASISDRGSGVYPRSLDVFVDGRSSSFAFRHGVLRINTSALAPGAHRLRVVVSDYQETRNVETIAGILPNTRFFTAKIRIR